MQVSNPYRLTIIDIMVYLDSLAIKEETSFIIMEKGKDEFKRSCKAKNVQCAQLLLRMAKHAAANNGQLCIEELLNELPAANDF
jgi:hypothetical protein